MVTIAGTVNAAAANGHIVLSMIVGTKPAIVDGYVIAADVAPLDDTDDTMAECIDSAHLPSLENEILRGDSVHYDADDFGAVEDEPHVVGDHLETFRFLITSTIL